MISNELNVFRDESNDSDVVIVDPSGKQILTFSSDFVIKIWFLITLCIFTYLHLVQSTVRSKRKLFGVVPDDFSNKLNRLVNDGGTYFVIFCFLKIDFGSIMYRLNFFVFIHDYSHTFFGIIDTKKAKS